MMLPIVRCIGLLCGVLLACHPAAAVCVAVPGAVDPTLVQARCAPLEVIAPLEESLGGLKIALAAPPPLELMHRVGVAMWRR